MVRIVVEENESETYGYYRCEECKRVYYAGTRTFRHADTCSNFLADSDEAYVYVINQRVIASIKALAEKFGDDHVGLTGISFFELRKQLGDV